MIEQPYNPNDLEFLLSRRLDEPLTAKAAARLQAALADDAALALTAEQLQRLHDLLNRWKLTEPAPDEPFAQRVADRIAEDDVRLDDLLSGVRADQPAVDWDRFAQGVMRQIEIAAPGSAGEEHFAPVIPFESAAATDAAGYKPPPTRRWLLRIGASLAAAAAIALTVTTGFWPAREGGNPAPINPLVQVTWSRNLAADQVSQVSYSRDAVSAVEVGVEPAPDAGIGMSTMAAVRVEGFVELSPF